MKRPLILFALVAVAALILWGATGLAPDLAALRHGLAPMNAWREAHPIVFLAGFFLAYVLVAALSLPFALWMTLAAGALFGLWQGVLIVSFASSIGATLAFLTARHLLRDRVRARLGPRLARAEQALDRDGALYLFTLRLVPLVPFFVVNLLMGLTRIPTLTFHLVSQAGMLAATLVYVNAGTRLARIETAADIASPALVASLALIGFFPWIARMIVNALKRRRLYARWPRPARFDRNLIVIGGGSAGLVSAYVAAAVKAKVTLVEAERMGGDCLNTGCVPSKTLISSARLAHSVKDAARFGFEPMTARPDFGRIMERVHAAIAAIAPHDSAARYASLGVEVLQGRASILTPWSVRITAADGTTTDLTTRAIVIATGAAPTVPPLPGLDATGYLTTETLWDRLRQRDATPARLVILGGGPVGVELGQAFARLGSAVTIVEAAPRILQREEDEVAAIAASALKRDGVTLLAGHVAGACGVTDGEKWIEVSRHGATRRIAFDDILLAVGRTARTAGLGLEALGIPVQQTIETNEWLETIYPNILCAGDVAGPYQFTHTASHQAWYASVNALFGGIRRFRADYRVIPTAIFTDPEIARVGLTEPEARKANIPFEVTRHDFADLDRAIADGRTAGFVKVLTVPGRDRILGVTIVGEQAAELIAEFVLAMKHGLGLGKILGTIHIYPTRDEANKFVAGTWRRAHLGAWVMALLDRYQRWRRG